MSFCPPPSQSLSHIYTIIDTEDQSCLQSVKFDHCIAGCGGEVAEAQHQAPQRPPAHAKQVR